MTIIKYVLKGIKILYNSDNMHPLQNKVSPPNFTAMQYTLPSMSTREEQFLHCFIR